ncbi:hypothetical protein CXB51_000126 [Gossypium anomalum]|uniref:Uncharacterized protein n=1 Tax=Gossypium anomalum TaxID=47600 RepID=A0A8J6DCM6_9ROSI|nr:hypothetical protein CXB51_000126 [Gossypium anomalum]
MNGPKEGSLGRATKKAEDDIEVRGDDMRKEIIDSVPFIDFSERVHSLIKKSMSETIVVKLFGRKICYNALWNKRTLGDLRTLFDGPTMDASIYNITSIPPQSCSVDLYS